MNIELSGKDYRFLVDLVYIGNWVLNSTRGNDRIEEYDKLMERIFTYSEDVGMSALVTRENSSVVPSRDYEDGGIHEAIADYEDAVFYEILAEELARRDMNTEEISPDNYTELMHRIDEYISEFEKNGVENISLDL